MTLYFTLFLAALAALTALHFGHLPTDSASALFFFCALGQAFLETLLLASIARLLRGWMRLGFIAITFLILIAQITDLILLRLMDASLGYLLFYFGTGGLAHIGAAFQGMNLSWSMTALIAAALFLLPACGIALYHFCGKVTSAPLRPLHLFTATLCTGTALLLFDLGIRSTVEHPTYHRLQKHLPFGATFLPPAPPKLPLSPKFFPARTEQLQLPHFTAQHTPNILLLVVESFRHDFVTPDVAPHLHTFGQRHLSFAQSTANSNATQTSWYALLHANTPLRWTQAATSWQQGAVPLRLFKQLGYRIHVLGAADFSLFGIGPLLFGKDHQLADTFTQISAGPSHERDAQLFQNIREHLTQEGNLILVFLDSTHSEYSFPDHLAPFQPIDPGIDYFSLPNRPEKLERVKNRYRNAIHYLDTQFGALFQHLQQENLYDSALIAITGDHGEEFFEDGALFHGTHLNKWQTAVPLLMKLPDHPPISTQQASHLNILPTFLHILTGQSDFQALFDGESLLAPQRNPTLIVQHNGGAAPTDFLLIRQKGQLRARLLPKEGSVALLSTTDPELLKELRATEDRAQTAD